MPLGMKDWKFPKPALGRHSLSSSGRSEQHSFDRQTYRVTIDIRNERSASGGRVESSQICPKCGRIILPGSQGLQGPQRAQGPEGQIVCRCTARPRRYWLHSRETVLLLCVLGLVLAFAITGFAARFYHGRRAELARSWFDRGNAELKAGRVAAALADFRTALIYAQHELPPEQQQRYQLNFVQALIAIGNTGEARAYLLDMWERGPGDSRINLELARLAAQAGNDADAKRYYNGAIYGVWDERPDDVLRSRMDTRLELYRYLMDRGEKAEAQSVLLASAEASLALNPHAPGLDPMERAHRAVRSYDAARTRIKACASEHGIALPQSRVNLTPFTRAASDELAEAALARHIEQLDPLMEFVYQMESAATRNCGPPSDPTNAALARIGGKTQASP